MSESQGDVTRLLHRARDPADGAARDELFHLVKRDLIRIARRHVKNQSPGHTLQASDLVDEAFWHLLQNQRVVWEDRNHYLRFAAEQMWRILVHHARRKRPEKLTPEQLGALVAGETEAGELLMRQERILALDAALRNLENWDSEACEVLRTYWFVHWQFRFDVADEAFSAIEAEPGVRSFKEVGRLLGISHGKAHRLYVGACKRLQVELREWDPEEQGGST